MAAQIKLLEAWKSINIEGYPVQLENNQLKRQTNGREVRITTIKHWKDDTRIATAKESFIRDAAKLWNKAPIAVKAATTIFSAKKEIKKFASSLPI